MKMPKDVHVKLLLEELEACIRSYRDKNISLTTLCVGLASIIAKLRREDKKGVK